MSDGAFRWSLMLTVAASLLLFVAWNHSGRLDRLEARPVPVVTTTTTTTTMADPGPTVPDGNVYRDPDGHCFGTSTAEAARRGLKPDPTCPGADL